MGILLGFAPFIAFAILDWAVGPTQGLIAGAPAWSIVGVRLRVDVGLLLIVLVSIAIRPTTSARRCAGPKFLFWRKRLPDQVSIGRGAGFHLADTLPISRRCEPRLRAVTDQLHTSTLRPGTLEKCLILFVTKVICWDIACDAIRRSIFPIGLPRRSNSVRIRA